jgi:hypothetical protein
MVFKGASLAPYLATHSKPIEVKQLADGGLDYSWIFTRKDEAPAGTVPAVGHEENRNASDGKAEGVLAELLIRYLTWDHRDANPSDPFPAPKPQRLYLVKVRTDAKGIVQAYSCESVQVSLDGGGWR